MSADLARLRRVRWAVRLALVLGVAASVAANVLHANPNPIAQAIAAWPPLALLLTVELISRVPVHRRSLAAVRMAATASITGIAAWVSYWHMVGVAARYGEQGTAPYLIPLSVDGLVVVASVCLVELAGRFRDAEVGGIHPPAAVVTTMVDSGLPASEAPAEVPAEVKPASRPRKAAASTAPKRPFAVTQRAAAALQSDGMDVPRIAAALGITERQVRSALKPVPVKAGGGS